MIVVTVCKYCELGIHGNCEGPTNPNLACCCEVCNNE